MEARGADDMVTYGQIPRTLWPLSVVEGDSESSKFVSTPWVNYIQNLPGSSHPVWVSHASPGNTLANIISLYATNDAPLAPNTTGIQAAMFVWAGTGDIFLNATTAGQTFALLQTLTGMAQDDGFSPIIPFTCLPRLNESAFNAIAAAYNVLIKASYPTIIDAAAMFPDPATFVDGVHLTDEQESALATAVNEQMVGSFSWV